MERGSERRKSERQRVRTSKVSLIWSEHQKYFQNVENHFVEKNVESQRMLDFWHSENTFDIMIRSERQKSTFGTFWLILSKFWKYLWRQRILERQKCFLTILDFWRSFQRSDFWHSDRADDFDVMIIFHFCHFWRSDQFNKFFRRSDQAMKFWTFDVLF
jgi:hypothetical protein